MGILHLSTLASLLAPLELPQTGVTRYRATFLQMCVFGLSSSTLGGRCYPVPFHYTINTDTNQNTPVYIGCFDFKLLLFLFFFFRVTFGIYFISCILCFKEVYQFIYVVCSSHPFCRIGCVVINRHTEFF